MSDSSINHSHDVFTRRSLEHLPTARSLVEQYLPADVVARLDLDTLKLQEGSFIDDELRESISDLLFEVTTRDGRPALVGILFEHKSYPDAFVALQLLRYMVNVWERQRRDGADLSVVIPIVLYHGRARWNVARSMRELIAASPELSRYIPDAETCLIDLSQIPDEQLGGNLRLQVMLRILKHIFDPGLTDHLEEISPLVRAIRRQENWLRLLETRPRPLFRGRNTSSTPACGGFF